MVVSSALTIAAFALLVEVALLIGLVFISCIFLVLITFLVYVYDLGLAFGFRFGV